MCVKQVILNKLFKTHDKNTFFVVAFFENSNGSEKTNNRSLEFLIPSRLRFGYVSMNK